MQQNPPALCIIPARFGSTRFPGKPLADATGQPLITHVIDRVRHAHRVGRILVATDDPRIAAAVQRHGGEAMMTRDDHPNGTSRLAEVVERLGDECSGIVVNVQGDEPEIEPRVIDELIEGLKRDPDAPMATLASPFTADEDPADPNLVKLVMDRRNRALIFSRSPIPYYRDAPPAEHTFLKHPGLYAYRREFLPIYAALDPTPLEQAEQLEQLRVLEHGYPIAIVQTRVEHHGIDTPQQYEAFVRRCAAASRRR